MSYIKTLQKVDSFYDELSAFLKEISSSQLALNFCEQDCEDLKSSLSNLQDDLLEKAFKTNDEEKLWLLQRNPPAPANVSGS